MTVEIEIEIKDQDIVDALTTAIESGISYWGYIKKSEAPNKYEDESRTENLIAHVMEDNGSLTIMDSEEDEVLGELTINNIKRGIKLFLQDERAFDPAMDADDADILFQYMVLGEQVFG